MNVVLLGAPGSGKGTQAERVGAQLGLKHVASGDLFRDNLRRDTRLGKLAREYMNRGELVPDQVTIEMLENRLASPDIEKGVMLDGFPRTLSQAEALDSMLSERRQAVSAVLHIEVSVDEIVRRLSGRLVCSECPASFHREFNPFVECPENRCEGQYLYQREDDRPETVRARIQTYRDQTRPLINHYRKRDLITTIDGQQTMGDVTRECLEVLRSVLKGVDRQRSL